MVCWWPYVIDDDWPSLSAMGAGAGGALAAEMRLGCSDAARKIFAEGPPNGPHTDELVARTLAALKPLPIIHRVNMFEYV